MGVRLDMLACLILEIKTASKKINRSFMLLIRILINADRPDYQPVQPLGPGGMQPLQPLGPGGTWDGARPRPPIQPIAPLGPGGTWDGGRPRPPIEPLQPLGPGGVQPIAPLGPGGVQPITPLGPGGMQLPCAMVSANP